MMLSRISNAQWREYFTPNMRPSWAASWALTDWEHENLSPSQDLKEADQYIQCCLENGVKTMFNIGLLHGSLEYRIAAFYARARLPLSIIGVDISRVRQIELVEEEIKRRWGPRINFEYWVENSRKLTHNELGFYDASFIDGDHTYAGVKADFELMLPHVTKIIGLHDIRSEAYGVMKFWDEIKDEYDHEEFIVSGKVYGIGVLYMKGYEGLHKRYVSLL